MVGVEGERLTVFSCCRRGSRLLFGRCRLGGDAVAIRIERVVDYGRLLKRLCCNDDWLFC